MPFPNEHAARLQNPDKYDRFRRENDKFGDGIHAIWGVTADGTVELQAIRFDSSKFTVAQAKKWLSDHDHKPISFEEATGKSESKGAPNRIYFKMTSFDSAKGEIEGLASVYGVVDSYNDVVEPGAFTRTIQHKKGKVPLLWQHDSREPIGVAEIEDSKSGLRVIGKLNLAVARAREAFELIKQGAINGFSIGYDTVKESWEGAVRSLKELNLWEISVVTFPANSAALIETVKSIVPFQDLPMASEDRDWDGRLAEGRVRGWANATDGPNEKYRQAFLWYDSENSTNFTAYKLQISDVIDGRLTAVPRGIFAAGAVLMGSRGGVDIPDSERGTVQNHLARYYRKMDRTPPWEAGMTLDSILAAVIGSATITKEKGLPFNSMYVESAKKSLEALLDFAKRKGSDPAGSDDGHSDDVSAKHRELAERELREGLRGLLAAVQK